MKHLKTGIWIAVLSILYAGGILRFFNISAELLLCFCGVYSILDGRPKQTIAVSLICGVLMSSFGGRGFVFGTLSCLYFAVLFLKFKPKKRPVLKKIAVSFVYMTAFEALFYMLFCAGIVPADNVARDIIIMSAICNTAVFAVMYLAVRRSYKEKERYIF